MEPIDLPKLVSTAGTADADAYPSKSAAFSPLRSSRRAQFVDDAAPQPSSPAPAPGQAGGTGFARPAYTRRQSSVSVNTVVELPLGNKEVKSVVARRMSTNPALLGASGNGRSLSWFAGAPHANTVAEDLQEEVLEEKQERALARDVSPLEQFNAELMAYLEENSKLQKGRDARGAAQLEDTEMVERRQRAAQLASIEKRRAADGKKFKLVDDMYDRAIQRRYRAMQKIAADPPADRLIGHNMMQYVPASLVPGYAPDHVAAHARANDLTRTANAHGSAPPPPTLRGGRAEDGTNPVVFLTEMDAAQGQTGLETLDSGTELPEHAARTGPFNTLRQSASAHRPKDRLDTSPATALRAPDALVEQWQELGYDVTYVDAQGHVLPGTTSAHGTTAGQRHAPATAASGVYDDQKWMKLAPLPGVCLVQKRLAPDVTGKTAQTAQVAESSRAGSRRLKGTTATGPSSSQWTFKSQP